MKPQKDRETTHDIFECIECIECKRIKFKLPKMQMGLAFAKMLKTHVHKTNKRAKHKSNC